MVWLHAIADITRAVNRSRPLPELLDLVAAVACRLTGYDAAVVWQVAEDAERLLIGGAAGFSDAYRREVEERPVGLARPEGPAARAFRAREPVTVRDIASDPGFRPWADAAEEQGYRAVACVPLLATEPVGVLACYTREVHDFPAREVALLTTLAEQAAIAVEAAGLRAREQAQIALLDRAERMRDDLLRVVTEEQGLEPLAASLRSMLGSPVAITDETGAVLAGELPDGREGAVVPALLGAELVARVHAPALAPPLGPLERRVLENGALVVALELLKRRTAQEVEWRLSGDLLGDVLAAEIDDAAVLARAARNAHDLTQPHHLLLVRADDPERDDRLLALVQRVARRPPPRAVVAARGRDVVVLWPMSGAHPARRLANSLRSEARRAQTPVSIAVGAPVSALADYAQAHRVARGALDLGTAAGAGDREVAVEDLGIYRLLLEVRRPEDLLHFADELLGPVRAHDERRDAQLVATLRAWLGANRSTADAGEQLVVHPNTVTYRLGRIAQLTGLDLQDAQVQLQLTLALMVLDVAGVSPSAGRLAPAAGRPAADGGGRARRRDP
jgi:GAF domain-containing protein